MTRHGSRDGTHFRKKLLNADGPVERILILLVIAVVAGVTIGLLMPKANPTVGEITGEYTASGSAAQTLQQLTVDDNQRHAGYDRDLFGFRQTDDDGNGCDVREDVLARDLTDVRYRQHGCKVESGTLADPYTGKTIHFVRGARTSSAVQIDHVVALENAWRSGAPYEAVPVRQRHVQPAGGGRAGQSGEGLRVGRVLAADERRIPLRLRGPSDRRESQVRADRHDEGEAGDAVRTACLPGAGRAGKVRDDRKYGLFADVTGYANETWSAGGTHLNRPYIATFARLHAYASTRTWWRGRSRGSAW